MWHIGSTQTRLRCHDHDGATWPPPKHQPTRSGIPTQLSSVVSVGCARPPPSHMLPSPSPPALPPHRTQVGHLWALLRHGMAFSTAACRPIFDCCIDSCISADAPHLHLNTTTTAPRWTTTLHSSSTTIMGGTQCHGALEWCFPPIFRRGIDMDAPHPHRHRGCHHACVLTHPENYQDTLP